MIDHNEISKEIVDSYIDEMAKMSQTKYQIELVDFSITKKAFCHSFS